MKFAKDRRVITTITVTFEDAIAPEVTKPYTSKVIRLEEMRVVIESGVSARVYGSGHRVLSGGRLGVRENLGQFGMSLSDLPAPLREVYRQACQWASDPPPARIGL